MIRWLSCCLSTMLLCSSSLPLSAGELTCEDFEPVENAAWIVIGPDSVMFADSRADAAKLAENSPSTRFVVACEEFQVQGQRDNGKTGLQIECTNATAFQTDNFEDAQTFLFAKSKCLKFDSQTQLLELIGDDKQRVQIVSRQSETKSMKLEAATVRIQFESTGHRLEIDSAQMQLESKIEMKAPEQTAKTEPVEVLYFNAKWCGPCQKTDPIVSKLQHEGLPIRFVNVDADEPLSKEHHVTSIPCFVFLRDGKEQQQLTGIQTEKMLRATFTSVRDGKTKCSAENPDTCCIEKSCYPCDPKPTTAKSIRGEGQEIRLIEFIRQEPEQDSKETSQKSDQMRSELFEALWPEVFEYTSPPPPKDFRFGGLKFNR